MTPDEAERMQLLCKQIEVEKSQEKFLALVKQLNDLLEGKNERLEHPPTEV